MGMGRSILTDANQFARLIKARKCHKRAKKEKSGRVLLRMRWGNQGLAISDEVERDGSPAGLSTPWRQRTARGKRAR